MYVCAYVCMHVYVHIVVNTLIGNYILEEYFIEDISVSMSKYFMDQGFSFGSSLMEHGLVE